MASPFSPFSSFHNKLPSYYSSSATASSLLDLTLTRRRGLIREGLLDIAVEHGPAREVYVILLTDVMLFTLQREGNFLLKCPGKTRTGESKKPVLRHREAHVRPNPTNPKGIYLIGKVCCKICAWQFSQCISNLINFWQ